MDQSVYTPAQTLERLPKLLDKLRDAQPHDIAKLTETRVFQHLQEQDKPHEAGVYAFCRKTDGVPVYVGRSGSMIKRLGGQHRSTSENRAAVTKAIKVKLGLGTMLEAREILYRDYDVRFISEPDIPTRAMLEIYASISWDTEFNTFIEH